MRKNQSLFKFSIPRANRLSALGAVLGASLLLTACGGGGGGGAASGTKPKLTFKEVPDTSGVVDDGLGVGRHIIDFDGGPVNLPDPRAARTPFSYGDPMANSQRQTESYATHLSRATGFHNTRMAGLSRSQRRGGNVRVAVVDSGFDVNHPDLADGFIWRPGVDRSRGNPLGRNFRLDADRNADNVRPRTNNGRADLSHGTHVAGIIAARDNHIGVLGIAPESKILPMRFLTDGTPDKYRYGADVQPGQPGFALELGPLLQYARDNSAFVMNASFSYLWRPRVREIDLFGGGSGYILEPAVSVSGYNAFTRHLLPRQVRTAFANARRNNRGMLVVVSAGNDGWNSDSGELPVYSQKFEGEDIHKYLNKDEHVAPRYVRTSQLSFIDENWKTNLPTALSAAFIGMPELKGSWLSVVAVDKQGRIASFSNGCGEAASYCLAAPGVNILSTVDQRDTYYAEQQNRRYGRESGTSMAAPVISGAAALLKARSPNLSADQVAKILLCTATPLQSKSRLSADAPDKSQQECLDKGPEATHNSGWKPDKVYGHGLVNLERALQPLGAQQAAAGNARGVAATRDTRVAFSSAFGNAASSQPLQFGGFDMFGRVFRYKAPLQDRVMPGPRLSGMLAMNGPADLRLTGRMGGVTSFIQHSDNAESQLGKGTRIGFAGQRGSATLSMVSRRTGISLSPASMMRRSDEQEHTPIWDGLAPQTRDIIHGETEFRLGRDMIAGAYFSQAAAEGATRRQQAYGVQDFGVSARAGDNASRLGLRLGRLLEKDRFLGSKAEGGYALARPTATSYVQLSADRRVARNVMIGANISHLRSHVDFRHDAFVSDMSLNARSAGAHLTVENAARSGDRLVLQYGEPLAVSGGKMRQTSVMGYDAGGAYKPSVSELDMKVRRRHRMAQIIYRAPLSNGITGFAAAAHHQNWSNHGGLQNNLVMLGLSLRH